MVVWLYVYLGVLNYFDIDEYIVENWIPILGSQLRYHDNCLIIACQSSNVF